MSLFDTTFLGSQLFWTGTAFAVLLLVMWKYVTPAVLGTLDARAERIKADLDAAEASRIQSEAALKAYEVKLAAAHEEVLALMTRTREDADALVASKLAQADEEIARKLEEAKKEADHIHTKALEDLKAEIGKMVAAAAEKLLGETVDAQTAARFAERELEALKRVS